MKTNWMKRLAAVGALALAMTAMSSPAAAATRFSVGIGIGAPGFYAPPAAVAYRPAYPGPGYTWVAGFYNPYRVWVPGYWAPPVVRGYGYGPRFYGGYYGGFRRGFEFRGRR